MEEIFERVAQLKAEKNAVILAHYYVNGDVQQVADYIGDSYYLSKVATTLSEKVIVFAGVNFMADSAKVLNPDKKVILPDSTADCPMAHMVTTAQIKKVRELFHQFISINLLYTFQHSDFDKSTKKVVWRTNTIIICKFKHFDKVLNPDKKVILPDSTADCPMAHMVTTAQIKKVRELYEDVAVVCYINSTLDSAVLLFQKFLPSVYLHKFIVYILAQRL